MSLETFLTRHSLIGLCVVHVASAMIQKRLLAEDGLESARVLEIAQGIEAAEKNSKELKAEQPTADLNFAGSSTRGPQNERCHRYGGRNHDPKVYRFKHVECYKCHGTGHIAAACRSQPKRQPAPEQDQPAQREGDKMADQDLPRVTSGWETKSPLRLLQILWTLMTHCLL